MNRIFRLTFFLLGIVLCSVSWPQHRALAESDFELKTGWTLALSGHWNQLSGALDGGIINGTTGGSISLADPEDGISYGLHLGGRGKNGALLLGYSVSKFDHVVSSGGRSTQLEIIDLNAMVFLWSQQRLQPFFVMGLNFPRLTLKNAATLNAFQSDARLDGYGINAGVGLAYFFTPHLSLNLNTLYREMRFDTIKGLSGNGSFNESLRIRNMSAGTSVSYTF